MSSAILPWLGFVLAEAAAPLTPAQQTVEQMKDSLSNTLREMNPTVAFTCLALALVSMTYGWKFYRVIVAVGGGLIGGTVGNLFAIATNGSVSSSPYYGWALALLGGGSLAFLAFPYLKLLIFFMIGSLGGYVMFIAAQTMAPNYQLPFTLLGFVVCGLVALSLFRFIIVLGTSAFGACALLTGVMYFVYAYANESYLWTMQNVYVLLVATVVLTLMGLVVQLQIMPEDALMEKGPKDEKKGDGRDKSRPDKRAEKTSADHGSSK